MNGRSGPTGPVDVGGGGSVVDGTPVVDDAMLVGKVVVGVAVEVMVGWWVVVVVGRGAGVDVGGGVVGAGPMRSRTASSPLSCPDPPSPELEQPVADPIASTTTPATRRS